MPFQYHPREVDPVTRQRLREQSLRNMGRRQQVFDVRGAKKAAAEARRREQRLLDQQRQDALDQEARGYARQQALAQQEFGFDRALLGDRLEYEQRAAGRAAQEASARDAARFGYDRTLLGDRAAYDTLSAERADERARAAAFDEFGYERELAADRAAIDAATASRAFEHDRASQGYGAIYDALARDQAGEIAAREGELEQQRALERLGMGYKYQQRGAEEDWIREGISDAERFGRDRQLAGEAEDRLRGRMEIEQGHKFDVLGQAHDWDTEAAEVDYGRQQELQEREIAQRKYDAALAEIMEYRQQMSQKKFTPSAQNKLATEFGILDAILESNEIADVAKVPAMLQWLGKQTRTYYEEDKPVTTDEILQQFTVRDDAGKPIGFLTPRGDGYSIAEYPGAEKVDASTPQGYYYPNGPSDRTVFEKRYKAAEDRLWARAPDDFGGTFTDEQISAEMERFREFEGRFKQMLQPPPARPEVLRDQWPAGMDRQGNYDTSAVPDTVSVAPGEGLSVEVPPEEPPPDGDAWGDRMKAAMAAASQGNWSPIKRHAEGIIAKQKREAEALKKSAAKHREAWQEALPRPQSKAEVDALPPGAQYVAPDGTVRRKL